MDQSVSSLLILTSHNAPKLVHIYGISNLKPLYRCLLHAHTTSDSGAIITQKVPTVPHQTDFSQGAFSAIESYFTNLSVSSSILGC